MHRRQVIGAAAAALAAGGGVARTGGLAPVESLDAAAYRRLRRFAETPFGSIAYVERGTGRAALFLHGFPLNGFQWRGAIERLEAHRRCIAPDFLGLGYTRVAAGQGVAADDQVAMLVAMLDRLGVGSADVIASDSGGAVAQLLAVRHPDRVRTLLLTNCDTEIDCPPPALLPVIELSKRGEFVDQWLAPWLADPELARSAQGIGGMCYVDRAHPTDEAVQYFFSPLMDPARKAEVHAYAVALERNVLAGIEPALRRSVVPTRILWGMADDIFSPRSPDYLDRTLGASRGVRRLPGSKLFWPEERPEVIAEEALRLWGG
jgi:haloalkane dehalogenase